MNALAKMAAPAVRVEPVAEDVLIHVRFQPNAEIFTIDRLPGNLTPKVWFNRLTEAASSHYRVLAGGRGFFRIPRSLFDTISQSA